LKADSEATVDRSGLDENIYYVKIYQLSAGSVV